MAEPFRLYLLGGFRLERDGGRIQLYSRKVESLLAYLALFPQGHAREKLAGLFWGDSTDEQARHSLRMGLSSIRKQLGNEVLLADRETVQLNPAFPLWSDTAPFSQIANRLTQGQASETIRDTPSAIRDYAELLPDFYDDWLETPREELRGLFLDAALKLTAHARTQSEYKTAVELAQKILSVDKANETAHQQLMFCYSALGDRAAALDQYEFCRRALREELGIEPSQETRALFETIRKQTETKSAAARLTNLPRPTTSFVGREREIGEIGEILGGERSEKRDASVSPHSSLLTLLGPGGSGKTRLAIEVGTHLLPEFPDGVWWVDFSALQDEGFVPNHVAKALGVQEQPNVPVLEALRESLHAKQLLLVLDNCEHVTKGAARLVEALLSTCPLSILATSRARLNVAGELVYPVSTLPTPTQDDAKLPPSELLAFEAVKLFAERARLHQSTFRLNEHNAPHVVRICQQLDGIPLALELAAAQIQSLSLDEIAARLEQRRELVDGTRAHSRQQTLHALIGWSYDLLTHVEQVLFRRLGVFAGGWTLEQAVVIAGGYADADAQWNATDAKNGLTLPVTASFVVSALLHNLVNKSLVLVEKERYRFLETIREYAREKLGQSDEPQTSARHFDYFLNMARALKVQLAASHDFRAGKQLEQDHDNVRAALAWGIATRSLRALEMTLALYEFWKGRGYLHEGILTLRAALAATPDALPTARTQALTFLADLHARRGELSLSIEAGTQALELAQMLNDLKAIGYAQYAISLAYTTVGDIGKALLPGRASYDAFLAVGDHTNALIPMLHNGSLARMAHDYETAGRELREAYRQFEQMQDRRGATIALLELGFNELALNHVAESGKLFGSIYDEMLEGVKDFYPIVLLGCVRVAICRNMAATAVQLAGAVSLLEERGQTFFLDADTAEYQTALEGLRAQVPAADWQRWWAAGRTLTEEELRIFVQQVCAPG